LSQNTKDFKAIAKTPSLYLTYAWIGTGTWQTPRRTDRRFGDT